ncbi:MAG: hypothetical protein PHO28_01975 [Candidatus Pacebacteria bacterium]|nr:hypothetical protein [Candidatus Paceibacterota bacterium]
MKLIQKINIIRTLLPTILLIIYLKYFKDNLIVKAEEYLIIESICYFVFIIGVYLLTLCFTIKDHKVNKNQNLKGDFIVLGGVSLISLIFMCITIYTDYTLLNQNNFSFSPQPLDCNIVNKNYQFEKLNKADLIKYLEKSYYSKDYKPIIKGSYEYNLFYLTQDKNWLYRFKESLIDMLNKEEYQKSFGSVKSKQEDIAIYAMYYLDIKNDYPLIFNELFDDSFQQSFIDWIYKANINIFKPTYADYLYAIPFRQKPAGPYQNQEIGVAALAIFREIIKDEYPELADEDAEFIKKYAVGWKENFKNPDDAILYQYTWIAHSWMLSKYYDKSFWNKNLAEKSFDYIIAQWPNNKDILNYNHYDVDPLFDIMYLGGYLLNDKNYYLMGNEMLKHAIETGRPVRNLYLFGTRFFKEEDGLASLEKGSCIVNAPTGTPQKPGEMMPDKIILRKDWDDASPYLLENLRFSGWHKYKATNSIIRIDYKYPFVVEKYNFLRHEFLPKGRADHRDKKWDRLDLNALQIEKTGINKFIWSLTKFLGFESKYEQDPPSFARIVDYQFSPGRDSVNSEIIWHNIKHNRIVYLNKTNNEIIIHDIIKNPSRNKYAISWHLKGDYQIINKQEILLVQNEKTIKVTFECLNYCSVVLKKSEYKTIPVDEINKADLDILVESDRQDNNLITSFIPLN